MDHILIEIINGMCKLSTDAGYLLHNVVTDTYSHVVYMPSADLSKFEVVKDESVPDSLRNAIESLNAKQSEMEETQATLNAKQSEMEETQATLNTKQSEMEETQATFTQVQQSLHKVAKMVASEVTDDAKALAIQEFYDDWEVGVKYEVGTYIRYEEVLYKVITAHTSQSDWTPTSASSLFAKVLIDPTGETINEWVQPDSTNAYMTGDKVIFEGKTYESVIDNNVWSPSAYPAGWKEI